jgi:2-polyprenyl-3-methyl-5-hydroxy-6-metoxy-1,4-benzoquinol methylase
MPSSQKIASAFLPRRNHYYYAWSKLATDPLYAGVARELREARGPLLDLGCGIGLLAHSLRAENITLAYRGVDVDSKKIQSAKAAASKIGLHDVAFETLDLARSFPEHQGDITLLDVLQFLPPERQAPLIENCLSCLSAGSRLIIRTGLHRDTWRMRITRSVDVLSRWWGWMNATPKRYPKREDLEALFRRLGFDAEFTSLRGRTPFENWLIVVEKSSYASTQDA